MNKEDNRGVNKIGINWYPGHMAKAKRLMKEKMNLIDIVVEVIDARMPYSSKMKEMDELIGNKKRMLIMSKKDLCDMSETKKWVEYYTNLGYHVLVMNIEKDFKKKEFLQVVHTLMKDTIEKNQNKGIQNRKTRLLVVGIPNVGKSTLINRLVGRKAVTVGNRPGVTKSLDWIRIDQNVELLDSPGILWPKLDQEKEAYNLASLTAIREEILPIYEVVVYILKQLEKYYPNILKERYGVEQVDPDVLPTLDMIGKRRGCLSKGGIVDYDKVYNVILNDIKNGVIKGITFDRKEDYE